MWAIKSLSGANCSLAELRITNLVIIPAAACLAEPCAVQERCAWMGCTGSVCLFGDQTWALRRCRSGRQWERAVVGGAPGRVAGVLAGNRLSVAV